MASNSALPILIGAGALAALAIAASSSGAPAQKAAAKPKTGTPPGELLERIAKALSSMDPEYMRDEADELEREGWVLQAGDLRRAAQVAELGKALGAPSATSSAPLNGDPDLARIKVAVPRLRLAKVPRVPEVPDEPQPDSPLPGYIDAAVAPPTADAKRIQAQTLINLLDTKPPKPGEQSKAVAAFQSANGLKPSGYYGAAVALKLALGYGLIPPRPINWPTKGRTRARASYRAALLEMAARDPQRAEEYISASKKV